MKNDDIFKKAAEESVAEALSLSKSKSKEASVVNIVEQALSLTTENTSSAWSRLKDKVNNEYAEKAMDLIEKLPDREFIKVYLKLMEYVNPKITRKEIIGNNDGDTEIKVLIVQNQNSSDEKIIDVTHSTQEEK